MALSNKHPLYADHLAAWQQMRDCYAGEAAVKAAGFAYLPATPGQVEDGIVATNQKGWIVYSAYRKRARVPDAVREAVDAFMGVLHRKPASITLPAALEPLRERATLRGESLELLLRKVNEEQLIVGRIGILGDVVDEGPQAGSVYLVTYTAERILNWDEGSRSLEPAALNLVVLDESEQERQADFSWRAVTKYRVLVLGDPETNEPEGAAIYRAGTFRETETFDAGQLVVPSLKGRTLSRIPFAIANPKDVTAAPDRPPLLGLADLVLAIYRGEADYRQSLFMQGQATLVTVGASLESATTRVGAGAELALPQGGDAKFIVAPSDGISEQREALENDYRHASVRGGELVDATSRQKESGEALRVRVAARTTTLVTVAKAGAFALEQVLKAAAEWVGANPDEVEVVPHLDFVDDPMAGKELGEVMTAKSIGAPLSLRSVHAQMRMRGMTELTYEEELAEIEREAEAVAMLGTPESSAEDGPEEDEEEGGDAEDAEGDEE